MNNTFPQKAVTLWQKDYFQLCYFPLHTGLQIYLCKMFIVVVVVVVVVFVVFVVVLI